MSTTQLFEKLVAEGQIIHAFRQQMRAAGYSITAQEVEDQLKIEMIRIRLQEIKKQHDDNNSEYDIKY